jgi:hypothetical protein
MLPVISIEESKQNDTLTTTSAANAKRQRHTTGGIPRWSPTLVLVARFSAYVWQSGRDAQFSLTYGRMYHLPQNWLYEVLLKGG